MDYRIIPLDRMNPAPYNPRKDLTSEDTAYQTLEHSIEEFGCVQALVWNERTGNLVGGHQTYKILLARGDTEAGCSVVDLPLEREKTLNIALNEIHGQRDTEKLSNLLKELQETDPDLLELTGITGRELEKLLGEAEQVIAELGELDPEEFADDAFKHTCPKCGFKFNE